jgi:hypothetical protein
VFSKVAALRKSKGMRQAWKLQFPGVQMRGFPNTPTIHAHIDDFKANTGYYVFVEKGGGPESPSQDKSVHIWTFDSSNGAILGEKRTFVIPFVDVAPNAVMYCGKWIIWAEKHENTPKEALLSLFNIETSQRHRLGLRRYNMLPAQVHVHQQTVYIVVHSDKKELSDVLAIDLATDKELWRVSLPSLGMGPSFQAANDKYVVVTRLKDPKSLYEPVVLSAKNGALLATPYNLTAFGAFFVSHDRVVFVSDNGLSSLTLYEDQTYSWDIAASFGALDGRSAHSRAGTIFATCVAGFGSNLERTVKCFDSNQGSDRLNKIFDSSIQLPGFYGAFVVSSSLGCIFPSLEKPEILCFEFE